MTHLPHPAAAQPATAQPATALPGPALRMGALLLTGALALAPGLARAQATTMPATDPAAATAPEANPAAQADAEAPADKPATADAAAPAEKPAGANMPASAAQAAMTGPDGTAMGTVTVMETESGAVHVALDLTGIAPGVHAVHIHETGDCTAPDFKSAGGHLSGGKAHGAHSPDGMHPGDLPNVTVGDDGALKAEFFTSNVTLAQMMDDDGAAFVMHAGQDDYTSQPAGDAGDRIACGVFQAREPS